MGLASNACNFAMSMELGRSSYRVIWLNWLFINSLNGNDGWYCLNHFTGRICE